MSDRGTAPHILVVDDDPSVRQMVVDFLADYDFRVSAVANEGQMTETLQREVVDLLVLDLRLEGADGMQIARRLREDSDLAIVVVTGRREEADRVMALELGADDYVTKPFSPRELLARIRAVLRRSKARAEVAAAASARGVRIYRFSGWELNVGLHRLSAPDGTPMALSNGEFNLLTAFLSAPNRVLTRGELLSMSRLHDDEVFDRSIDVQVGRLRRKLDLGSHASPLIQTERGAGYMLKSAVEAVR